MLTIKHLVSGQEDYYLNISYYLPENHDTAHGIWIGRGCSDLELDHRVEEDHFRRLFAGFHPHSERPLVKNAGQMDGEHPRQPGWDLCFSAPKSVSVLYSQADPELRAEIEKCQLDAVKTALGYLEKNAAYSRTGKGGSELTKAHLVTAAFQHTTSRGTRDGVHDVQLHTHGVCLNVGVSPEDGKTRTLVSRLFYEHQKTAGAVYRADFAHLLETRLDLQIERSGYAFEVVGVPEELTDAYSSRRKQILEALESYGHYSAKAAEVANLQTRQGKEHTLTNVELFEQWRAFNSTFGFDEAAIEDCRQPTQRSPGYVKETQEIIDIVLDNLTQQQSHFTEKELVRQLSIEAQGRGVPYSSIESMLLPGSPLHTRLVELGAVDGERQFSTKEVIREEAAMLEIVHQLQEESFDAASGSNLHKTLERYPTASEEQADAVKHITQSPGRLKIVNGLPGTGKTYMLKIAREALEQQGYRVIGAALAAKAAKGLEQEAGIPSMTLARFLGDFDFGTKEKHKHQAEQPMRASQGKPMEVDSKTIVVVDEAGMVGTRQMKLLVDHIEQQGATLVLVGDDKQIQPIEAGGPFRSFQDLFGHARLTNILRQQESWDAQAVHDQSEGNVEEVLQAYLERDRITVAPTRREAIKSLVADWSKAGAAFPDENLIFTGTHAERKEINHRCTEARLQRGILDSNTAITINGQTFYQDDRIVFRENNDRLDLQNGVTGTITSTQPILNHITVKLDDGKLVTVPFNRYNQIEKGYCLTTHSSQGVTIPNSYVLLGGGMQDKELSFVQTSRHKLAARLYVDEMHAGPDLSNLARQMKRSRAKGLAHDVRQIAEQQLLAQENTPNLSHHR